MNKLSGLDGKWYNLPKGATQLQDLIEHKNMNFSIGNIFKACYRLGDKPGTDILYDLYKMKFYVEREIKRWKKSKVVETD